MKDLHTAGVVHSHIRMENVGINTMTGRASLLSLELSRRVPLGGFQSKGLPTDMRGAGDQPFEIHQTAPARWGLPVDSWAVTLNGIEAFTRGDSLPTTDLGWIGANQAYESRRLSLVSEAAYSWGNLCGQCLSNYPNRRLTAAQIVNYIEKTPLQVTAGASRSG
ncbi:hypothetical protein LTR56_007666 [Elasticomyces elasticus]|nr:hypothetical protein LTR56_007666 [Elasticomyces elasticus]KAK3665366.1 hypothetical protein LTR22_003889 [Elasticomyces elasticus]KAK4929660.1 hypothetical protein LTR49_003617 [Elasticomyces elasticus]KAK5761119.1 hypothetical protein LTS12_008797 [Elasticomyces elasticus]